ncbi:unnamed protein product, partial [marine sediment metagenome]
MGDPSYDWDYTVLVCEWLGRLKTPVIVTKHWMRMSDNHASALGKCCTVINTSTSPLDNELEIEYRINEFNRLKEFGIKSILRVVSAKFGKTDEGERLNHVQNRIMNNSPIIDNPLRIPVRDGRVVCGDIAASKHISSIGGFGSSTVSVVNHRAFLGKCGVCPDQCGVNFKKIWVGGFIMSKFNSGIFSCKEEHRE